MYNYNLLVSYTTGRGGGFFQAKQEISTTLQTLGDDGPIIEKTLASGIIGVTTRLNNRDVISRVRDLYEKNPLHFNFTLKWVPVDYWCNATLEEMKFAVDKIKGQIEPGETWAMQVEKRRFTKYHSQEIIEALAMHIKAKVDLRKPDKILRVEILGENASITILRPEDIFSIVVP